MTISTLTGRVLRARDVRLVLLALIVGLATGGGAVLLRKLITWANWIFFDLGGQYESFLNLFGSYRDYAAKAHWVVVPALGMLIVGWIVRRWAMEAQGHGVPEVQYAVNKRNGIIRPRVALVKSIASALCIGSGGSVGREGPIVQIGCSLGSTVGQLAKLTPRQTCLMVGCGSAAAIGGTFNAPIAGVMFALEVVLGSFAARSFGLVVISSVAATAVCRVVLGNSPAFELVVPFRLGSAWEFPLYVAMGLVIGLISLGYVKSVYFFEEWFERLKCNPNIKTVGGGLAVGVLALLCGGHIFGVGHEGIELALSSTIEQTVDLAGELGAAEVALGLGMMVLLVFLKILATSITLGAGGSGGVFAPALFIGAMAGGAFGIIADQLFPGLNIQPGAYALVGMAAMFGGAAHAPISSILILFEMTDDYHIILPLMVSVVISHLLTSTLMRDSIYSIKLRRLGGLSPQPLNAGILDQILVVDAMSPDVQTVKPDMKVSELVKILHDSHTRSFPVVDAEAQLVGIVTEYDVENVLMSGDAQEIKVGDIMSRDVITCRANESLNAVAERFTEHDVRTLPVVSPKAKRKLAGVLQRDKIIWAYGEMAAEYRRLRDRVRVGEEIDHEDSIKLEVHVKAEHSQLCFKEVRNIGLPEQCLVVILRRANHAVIPKGKTIVEPGDVLVVLTTRENGQVLRDWVQHLRT